MSKGLSIPMGSPPAETSREYKIHIARLFHNTASREFEARREGFVETTLVNLLIAVDYLIEAQEAQVASGE